MILQLLLLIGLFPAHDDAQSIAALQVELRRLGCEKAHCTAALRCADAAKSRDQPTDFGRMSCVPVAPFDQLSELTLDGTRVALLGNLTLPAGNSLQNVTVTNQPYLQRIDMSALTNVDNAIVADNAALVALVVAGGCVRVFSNPRLALVLFASPLLTHFVELVGNPLLAAVDLAPLGAQLSELKLIALNSLAAVTGLRGRTLAKVTIADNPALVAADDLDFAVASFLNVSSNPKLNGACRVRPAALKSAFPDGCAFSAPCLVGVDRCLPDDVCPGKDSSRLLRCSQPLSTPDTCPLPSPVPCPPYSLRFTTFGDTSLARSRDVAWCATLGAPLTAGGASSGSSQFACTLNVTSTSGTAFGATKLACSVTLAPSGSVRAFAARDSGGANVLTLQSVAPSTDCSLRLLAFSASSVQLIDTLVTSLVEFTLPPPSTTTTTARTTASTSQQTFQGTNSDALSATTAANATLSIVVIDDETAPTSSADGQQVPPPNANALALEAIIGIVAGVLALFAIAVVIGVCWAKRRSKRAGGGDEPLHSFNSDRYVSAASDRNRAGEQYVSVPAGALASQRQQDVQISAYDTVPNRRPTNNYAALSASSSQSPPPSTYTAMAMHSPPPVFTQYGGLDG